MRLIFIYSLVLLFASAEFPSAASRPQVSEQLQTRPRLAQPINEQVEQFLLRKNASSARVWIFFTDKNDGASRSFASLAAGRQLTERAAIRRAKMGLDRIVFADLPVSTAYIEQVKSIGATIRRPSRWLNAVSVDVPHSLLAQLAQLPFVAEIRPVATSTRPNLEESLADDQLTPNGAPQQPDVLSYGSSLNQLTQITVPEVHDQGYDGSGITLAIFDTGFRKTHEAFAQAYAENRVLAEYDFVFEDGNTANEAADDPSQWNHGTYIWSVSGGQKDGTIYGPAYKANFILCKTEYVVTETHAEEDNWVAAVEWVDSIGADVITSSLGYFDFDPGQTSYTYADLNGLTTIITQAANTAASLGIVVCNSMGNSGPGAGTLSAPADAFDILSVGAVNSSGVIASFSSRGPTFDGRTKPEVCARGVSTFAASASSTTAYTNVNGTSLSTPLVAGAACLLLQARPTFTPQMVRQALMATATQAATPDNTYGSGIIDLADALSYGATIASDLQTGQVPLTVQFTGSSQLTPTAWNWDFGDGSSSTLQSPSHTYLTSGLFDVSLTVTTTEFGDVTMTKTAYVRALADTLSLPIDSGFAGASMIIPVLVTNSQPLVSLTIPLTLGQSPVKIVLDSVTRGSRTTGFQTLTKLLELPNSGFFSYQLEAGSSSPLSPGSGEVLKLYCHPDRTTLGGLTSLTQVLNGFNTSEFVSDGFSYAPGLVHGTLGTKGILRGDANYSNDGVRDIADLTFLVGHLYLGGVAPVTLQSGDVDADLDIDIADVTYLVDYLFINNPAIPFP